MRDRNGVFVDYKPAPADVFFVPPQLFLGKSVQEILPPPIASQAMQALSKTFETGLPQIFDFKSLESAFEGRIYEGRFVRATSDLAIIIVRDITEQKWLERQRIYSLELEQTLANISTQFLTYTKFDEVTMELLCKSTQVLQVDKAFLYRYSPDQAIMTAQFQWFRPDLPESHHIAEDYHNNLPASWFDVILKNQPIVFPGMIPDEAVIGPYLRERDVKALLIMPIFLLGDLIGFLGFADVTQSHIWTPDDLSFARNVTEILARAIERFHTSSELSQKMSTDELQPILNLMMTNTEKLLTGSPGEITVSQKQMLITIQQAGKDLLDRILLRSGAM